MKIHTKNNHPTHATTPGPHQPGFFLPQPKETPAQSDYLLVRTTILEKVCYTVRIAIVSW